MKDIVKKILLATIIFGFSVAGPAYSLWKKGYAPAADYLILTQARNYALAGTYKSESSTSVFLSPARVAQEGVATGITNPLTSIIYGYIFTWFGFHPHLPFWIAIFLFGLFNVGIFLLIDRLVGIVPAFLGGLVSALMPAMTIGALQGGFYEWAMLFFVGALWLFLGSKRGPLQASPSRIVGASILFALAALARNAFGISFIPFFFFDLWYHRSLKRSAALVIPFLLMFGSTLTPFSWLGVPNGYTANVSQPWFQVGHFFNDPYQYHFNREEYIKDIFADKKALDKNAFSYAIHFGYPITLSQRLSIYRDAFSFYVTDLLNFTSTGGFLIWFMVAVGIFELWRRQRALAQLFGVWFLLWFGFLIYSRTSNWDHTMEIILMFSTLVGVGCVSLIGWLKGQGWGQRTALASVAVLITGHLAAANQWRLFDTYRSSRASEGVTLIDVVNKGSLGQQSVIAMGVRSDVAAMVAYETDRSIVFFHPDTIQELIVQKKLLEAFQRYNVSAAVGYSPELSDQIRVQAPGVHIEPLP